MKTKIASAITIESDTDYAAFERLIAARVSQADGPLFTTDATDLFQTYLAGIPETFRQHYNCRSCQRFIERYGGLVSIAPNGYPVSLLWGEGVGDFFVRPAVSMCSQVHRAKITGPFLSSEAVWGQPVTGAWTHLSGTPAAALVYANPVKTAAQAMAEKKEEYAMLCRGLAEIPMEAVVQAVRVLEADAVDRSEKTLGIAQWLLALHQQIADKRGPARNNLVWLAVAKAPPGWCHVRSTMIATLLDDIVAGLPYEQIARRWADKMHPLQYQRPSQVKEGTLKQANEIVERLGSAGALQRRFARLGDVVALWRPSDVPPSEAPAGRPFDHLMPSKAVVKPVELPAQKITWEKFRELLSPDALKIDCLMPYGDSAFYGLVTAANADAPPMIQWDGLEGFARNPASWYFYVGGSTAAAWGLTAGAWTEVKAVCLKPCHWQQPDKFSHQGPGVFFVLAGAKDLRHTAGAGLFPEILRSEYHGIRSAIEAYSRVAELAGRDEADANGIALNEKNSLRVRVTTREAVQEYMVSLS